MKNFFMSEEHNKAIGTEPLMNKAMFYVAQQFSNDLLSIHPLSKLKGINTNEWSRSKMPDLSETTEDYADDLVMAIDELLNPAEDIQNCVSWQLSRQRVCASALIIKRIHELR